MLTGSARGWLNTQPRDAFSTWDEFRNAHHAYNLVKLPGSGGTIVIRGVVLDALYAAQTAYKAAAVASPADEDEEPLPRPPAKKKQLFSQEKATTKQVPLEASGSGSSITIGANLPTK